MFDPRAAGRTAPALLGGFTVVALLGCGAPALRPQPNLVLLVLDTLRADALGVYAEARRADAGALPRGVSPELDALAREGVRFSEAIAPSSWTRPAMGSLFTSRYPRTLGLYVEDGDALRDEFTTLAEALRAGGYRTIGLTANPNLNRAFNFQQGHDHYVDGWHWLEPGTTSKKRAPLPTAPELFAHALELVAEPSERPTYLWLQLMEIHEHHRPDVLLRPEHRERFAGHPDAAYLASVHQLQADVAAFVEALAALPGFEDTLFVITSDHGEGLDSHPHVANSRFHGRLLYETQTRVPLILYANQDGRLPRGRVEDTPVRLLDLMPTLLDYAAVPAPDGMVGVSLRPLVDGAGAPAGLPADFVVETQFRGEDKLGIQGRRFTLIENRVPHEGTPPLELQARGRSADGLRTDRSEAEPGERDRLRAALGAWEARHPRAAPWRSETGLSDAEREQLRAIGYLP